MKHLSEMSFEELLDPKGYECPSCGKHHFTGLKAFEAGRGVVRALPGMLKAGRGSIINMALQSSKLTGAVDPVAMTVDSASEWDITGNSIVSSLSNAGTVKFVDPTSTPPALTLTVQGPLSSSGTMTLNTQLGTDGSPSDVIILNGATATTGPISFREAR